MTALTDIEARRIRHETIRALIAFLARAAKSPRRVGLRVLLLNFVLSEPETRPKQKQLAKQLGLSRSRTSTAIAGLTSSLEGLRK